MKKIVSIAAAVGLTASIAATASAAEVTGTVTSTTATTSTYGTPLVSEPIITQADIVPATPVIILTRTTPFYFTNGTTMLYAGSLSPQTVDTTGEVVTDAFGNEWREVYTWRGLAWIMVPNTAYVITP